MTEPARKQPTTSRYELLVAVILGLLAVGSFAVQALTLTDKTTKQETVLFNTLQFLLTVGFAWFSTRAVSRNEFEASLKRFAISAYRRISDIENMIQRLQTRIITMRAERAGEDTTDLDIAEAIVADTVQVVSSSIADWADVIGEELIALETIKRLKNEKAEIKTEPSASDDTRELDLRVKQIDDKIDSLISSLPARLQLDTQRQSAGRLDEGQAVEWINNRHKEQNGLRLRVISGGKYVSDRDPETLSRGDQLFGVRRAVGISVEDSQGVTIGRLLNAAPCRYDIFAKALRSSYGIDRIPLEFDGMKRVKEEDGVTYKFFNVRVAAPPLNSESVSS